MILLSISLLFISHCFCQAQKIQDVYSGIEMELSSDKKSLIVTYIRTGSPADISSLLLGDRIIKINGQAISEISDFSAYLRSTENLPFQIEVKRIGDDIYSINLFRASINLFSTNVITEAELFGLVDPVQNKSYSTTNESDEEIFNELENKILSSDNPKAYSIDNSRVFYNVTYYLKRNIDNSNQVTILRDYNYNILNYKTYDFEFLSKEDPLTEKSLLYEFEGYLQKFGLKRDSENPDILIIINFYSGQKEQYVPPQQIISTKIQSYFNWYWGYIPVPVTESKSKEGYTKTTYLTNISLKFLDFKTISTSKTPPVIWSATYSEVSPTKTFLTDRANDIYSCLIYQFPIVIQENCEDLSENTYAYTGIIYDKNNLGIIADVIPGSPASQSGIIKGDEILNINERKLPETFLSDKLMISWGRYTYTARVSTENALTYLYNNAKFKDADPTLFKPLKEENEKYLSNDKISLKIKRNGKKMDFEVTPQYKSIIFYKNTGFTIE